MFYDNGTRRDEYKKMVSFVAMSDSLISSSTELSPFTIGPSYL